MCNERSMVRGVTFPLDHRQKRGSPPPPVSHSYSRNGDRLTTLGCHETFTYRHRLLLLLGASRTEYASRHEEGRPVESAGPCRSSGHS